ncbi:MAG TPA: ubiquinone biosynthesis hydroxylase [Xanthobacteraceae bacterium]|nr:ubiquinone biosynthesis hydroxylase [Xanthobacteraceae bacterium]
MRQANAKTDVLIAGAGIPGLTLALALARALKPGFAVTVCDPSLAFPPAADDRVSAITSSARKMLEALGIWPKIAAEAEPVREMVVTDSKLENVVRPTFLTFDEERGDGPLAHIVEHRALAAALREAAKAEGVELWAKAVDGFEIADESIAASIGEQPLAAKLLVAADGARSKLRAQAKISSVSADYKQLGIVATIGHEREHNGIATQHFLPAGTFATLPLTGKRSSIVWAEESDEARRLVALPTDQFKKELIRRFGLKLGEIEVLSKVRAFPLSLSIARSFTGERLALLGDAAHVIHPLAGQGLNLGLRDAAALAEAITEAARLGLDPGGPEVLKRYQRWRRFDTVAMAGMTDGLNRLFSNDSDALRVLRDVGLGLVERAPKLKQFFTHEAAGTEGDTPKLMRGEVL